MEKQTTFKKIMIPFIVVLVIATIIGSVFLFKPKDVKTLNVSYEIGGLDDEGNYIKTDDSIYSDIFECQGLNITKKFNSSSKYKVYFYREDETFLSCTEELNGDFNTVPTIAKYARVLIKPDMKGLDSKEFRVSAIKVWGYSRDIKIQVNAKQEFELKNYFNVEYIGRYYEGTSSIQGGFDDFYSCFKIDLTKPETKNIKSFIFKFSSKNTTYGGVRQYFTAENKILSSKYVYLSGQDKIINVPEGATYFYVNVITGEDFVINQYS